MTLGVKTYLLARTVRWLAWIGFLLYALHYVLATDQHRDRFGHLLPTTEACLFGIALVAVFAGFFELMAREKFGLAQPDFGQLVPRKSAGLHQSGR